MNTTIFVHPTSFLNPTFCGMLQCIIYLDSMCSCRWIVVSKIDITCLNHDIIGEPIYICKEQGLELHAPDLRSASVGAFKKIHVSQLPSQRLVLGISPSLNNKEINPTMTPIWNFNPYQKRWLIRGHIIAKKEIHPFKIPKWRR